MFDHLPTEEQRRARDAACDFVSSTPRELYARAVPKPRWRQGSQAARGRLE